MYEPTSENTEYSKALGNILCHFCGVGRGMGQFMAWRNSEQIFAEVASLYPSFSGINYEFIEHQYKVQWPCNDEHSSDSPCINSHTFPISKTKLIPVEQTATAESPDRQYPFWLTTICLHYHNGCASMIHQSPTNTLALYGQAHLTLVSPKGFFFAQNEALYEFDGETCVGCGRCEQTCSGSISVHIVIRRIEQQCCN